MGNLSSSKPDISFADLSDLRYTIHTDVDLAKFDEHVIDGRLYTTAPENSFGHTYELDLSFNAQIIKPATEDAPITAGNGQPLPADGGAPGQAFMAFNKAVEKTTNLKELTQVLEAWLSAKPLAEMKQEKIPAAEEKASFELFKSVLSVKDARIEGGFVSNDKATLSITGTDDGKKTITRMNMHLENGQWKVGAGSTRVGDGK